MKFISVIFELKLTPPMTSPTKILQIVPRLSPDVDGVGDYALLLAHQLRDRHHILTDFLVFRPSLSQSFQIKNFSAYPLIDSTVESILAPISSEIATIVLQYSNYPYLMGKLDRPTYLVKALRELKQRQVRIIVMFHELPTLRYRGVSLPNPIQRRISQQLAQLADVVVTNNSAFQKTLSGWVNSAVYCIPNFSTIGEPTQVLPLRERERSLMIFGNSDRGQIYKSIPQIKQVCQQLNIQTLFDVGRPIPWDSASLETEVNIIKTGFLNPAELSQLMLKTFAGLFDYHRFPRNLAKSTIYAAYCAHGLLPICNRHPLMPQDQIFPNQHYLDMETFSLLYQQAPDFLASLQTVADNAHTQYATHTLSHCAKIFASFLQPTYANL